jgi:hypothetical protein
MKSSIRCIIVFDDPLGETVMKQMYGGLMKPKNIYGIISMNESLESSWIDKIKQIQTTDKYYKAFEISKTLVREALAGSE